ncbi:hypothetical protein B0T44_18510 [Nocardia donostiensis]|uniref:Rieske domain-containing protein n=1 Tax=Nocardia donostiensis TaxID=1538463 RepID=A0A1W0B116_9NOCA|nr:hypothetical protein B0T46_12095 [Nocardia donostiensis]OQS16170.1 hypothetical protein B0T36_05110 [Nocardia donostiensis]OQS18588.1 hypothetical protein B0T44_18510 [Nocardia donostiensis]
MRPLTNTLEQARKLDAPAQTVAKTVRQLLSNHTLKDTISGTSVGHPVHPPLTDLVIGPLLATSLLDVLATRTGDRAAQLLITVGIAAGTPTALTGISDWADTELSDEKVRRLGLVHAVANASALLIYAASLTARRRGKRTRGKLLALTGATLLGGSGYLGGHMSYVRGVGVNQTAFDPGPEEWTPVVDATELRDRQPYPGEAADTPVLLVRDGSDIYAIHNRCGHRGCLLSNGELQGHVVTCACHGSQFDIRDGTLLRGPATTSQPAFDTRESDRRVEIRRSPQAGATR